MRPSLLFIVGLAFLGATLLELGFLFYRLLPSYESRTFPIAGDILQTPTAKAGGTDSTPGAEPPNALKLAVIADPTSYSHIGQIIIYSFVITNTGPDTLGPSQFTISDDHLGASFGCGPASTTLPTNTAVSCAIPYIITQADMSLVGLSNNATASGGGAPASQPSRVTITNLSVVTATPNPPQVLPSALIPGTTIQHQVAEGEWLLQIASCYGASFGEVRDANPKIVNPDQPLPGTLVIVPNIGSSGKIYGPPCISFHAVQVGDNWSNIAERYNADLAVLQRANPGGLVVGQEIKIPLNSAGGGCSQPQPLNPTVSGPPLITSGGLPTNGAVFCFKFPAKKGQIVTMMVTTPGKSVRVSVSDPDGRVIKPAYEPALSWSATVPKTGDYNINIVSDRKDSNKNWSLELGKPSAVPLATATASLPATTPAPSLVIQAEWPPKLEVGRPGMIRIYLFRAGDAPDLPTLEIGSTSIASPVTSDLGTPGVSPQDAFGVDYKAFAIPTLTAKILNPELGLTQEQSLDELTNPLVWAWTIQAEKSDLRKVDVKVIVSMRIEWRPRKGGEPIEGGQLGDTLYLNVEVVKPWITIGELSITALVTGFIGSVINFPFLYGMMKEQRKKTKQKPRRKSQRG